MAWIKTASVPRSRRTDGAVRRDQASSVHVTFAREAEWKFLGEHGFLQRNDQQFHWHNQGYGCFEIFWPPSTRATARRSSANGAMRWPTALRFMRSTAATSPKTRGMPFSISIWIRLAEMGPALSEPLVLFACRRDHGEGRSAGHGPAPGPLDRRRHQFHRFRYIIRPQLGRDRTSSVPAFRGLLLSGLDFAIQRGLKSSRRARKASTRSRAGICRRPPTPRTTSPTPAAPRHRRISQA